MKTVLGLAIDEGELLAIRLGYTRPGFGKGYEQGASATAVLRGASSGVSGSVAAAGESEYREAVAWAESQGLVGHEVPLRAFVTNLLVRPGAAASVSTATGRASTWVTVSLREADATITADDKWVSDIPDETLRRWLSG